MTSGQQPAVLLRRVKHLGERGADELGHEARHHGGICQKGEGRATAERSGAACARLVGGAPMAAATAAVEDVADSALVGARTAQQSFRLHLPDRGMGATVERSLWSCRRGAGVRESGAPLGSSRTA